MVEVELVVVVAAAAAVVIMMGTTSSKLAPSSSHSDVELRISRHHGPIRSRNSSRSKKRSSVADCRKLLMSSKKNINLYSRLSSARRMPRKWGADHGVDSPSWKTILIKFLQSCRVANNSLLLVWQQVTAATVLVPLLSHIVSILYRDALLILTLYSHSVVEMIIRIIILHLGTNEMRVSHL